MEKYWILISIYKDVHKLIFLIAVNVVYIRRIFDVPVVCSDSAAGSLVHASLLTWPANVKISAFESDFLMSWSEFCAFCVVEHE
jgi:hypothetical protein